MKYKILKSILSTQNIALTATAHARRNVIFAWFSDLFFSKLPVLNSHFKPATLAVLVQGTALLLVLTLCYCLQALSLHYFNVAFTLTLLPFIVALSIVAMLLSVLVGMDSWWRWIHAGFPLAGWAMAQWHIPSEVYLAAFLISLSLYWTTFRTQVPFFPSKPIAWRHVIQLLPTDRPVHFIDIGSGIGDMVMHVAKEAQKNSAESTFTGIEIAVLPWLVSVVRACLQGSNAVFRLGNYHQLDFAQYDVVFAYLSPAAMDELWQKAGHEMRPGSLLVSYEFEIPGFEPDVFIPGIQGSPSLYGWHMATGNG